MISSPANGIPYPARRAAFYVAFIVFTATMFSFLDRQILAILVDPIRRDLHVSDTEMSLLYGFAFVILYSTLGLPIGRLIDRHQRRLILATGIAVWSLMTMACGLAHSYAMLFCARIGVGIGEACLTPAACSLLADCFEPGVRGRAMGFYLVGVYSGIGLSLLAGGLLYGALARSPGLPLLGGLAPWRAVFVIVGSPGLVIAALALTLREPGPTGRRTRRRGGTVRTTRGSPAARLRSGQRRNHCLAAARPRGDCIHQLFTHGVGAQRAHARVPSVARRCGHHAGTFVPGRRRGRRFGGCAVLRPMDGGGRDRGQAAGQRLRRRGLRGGTCAPRAGGIPHGLPLPRSRSA